MLHSPCGNILSVPPELSSINKYTLLGDSSATFGFLVAVQGGGTICSSERLTGKVCLNSGYYLMLKQFLQMQRRSSLGLGKRLASSVDWSLSCFISPCLEPLQLMWHWGEQGTQGMERVAMHGEVLLEEAAAQGRQEKAGQGQLTRGWASLLEEGGNREGGAARADQGLFSQLAFAFQVIPSMYIFTAVAQGLLSFLYFNK